ncbi:MAG TPA: hypothetical protein VGP28_07175 [Methylocella sp.]|jgi:hypothetical protein|nr:hypothetical protein [Methylocella sp.]
MSTPDKNQEAIFALDAAFEADFWLRARGETSIEVSMPREMPPDIREPLCQALREHRVAINEILRFFSDEYGRGILWIRPREPRQ